MAKIIKLRSSDDKIFEVEDSVAKMSITIKNMLDGENLLFVSPKDLGDDDDSPIPIPNVTEVILNKVLIFVIKGLLCFR